MQLDLRKLSFIKNNEHLIPWIIWGVAGCYYFFEIILRMLPSTMTNHLMQVFHINATQLGMFTAFYYWSYIIMQIPAGLIVDRYSVRKTLFFACLMCLIGFIVIHNTTRLPVAEFGRFLIGFGSAFAYVSALKVAAVWLPANKFGLASCIVDSLGMIGAMFVELALVRINVSMGFHSSIELLVITGILVATLIFFVLRDRPIDINYTQAIKETNKPDTSHVGEKLLMIMKKPQVWLIGIIGCLFYLPSSVIGDLWGIPYLHTVYHLTKEQSANMLAAFFAGWTILGPFLGAWSDKIGNRCMPIALTIALDALLFSIIIFLPHFSTHLLSHTTLYVMFFFIGVATGTHPLIFAIAKENFSTQITGTVVAFTNTLIMLGGLLFQPLVGFLLDFSHHSLKAHTLQHYTSANYTFALSIIPLSLIACLLMMVFVKETGHKHHTADNPNNMPQLDPA